jgi:Flp pilus assembly pilin Flp
MFRVEAQLSCVRDEQGQTFVEYALILAVVVVGTLLAVTWSGLAPVIQAAMDAVAGAV